MKPGHAVFDIFDRDDGPISHMHLKRILFKPSSRIAYKDLVECNHPIASF